MFLENSQPNVSNYGSFYQPNSTSAVNYCVNNGLSSASSLSSVNTVYSYSGPPPPPPPPPPRTESSNNVNLSVSTAGDHGAQQIPKPLSSHQQQHQPHHHAHSHPPMYMSPGIRNQTSNHTCMFFVNIN